ncbi:unnamed protein product [Dracunculus medinensis]|uniref:RPA_C domain-containing protein n=1 Tax=Dracunculus medinensis TaxID=318479 RepID=A0A0N4UQH6_DRAME|nr:unnamed protein product [Dracunculus medinensis]
MSAWANESFDVGLAGGFGDSSFATAESAFDRSRITDKIPIPASVADLCAVDPNDEKYTLGKFAFSTVRVIGQIKSSSITDDGQSIEYIITDPKVSGAEFLVTHYRGISQDDISADPIVEGTEILAFGKLRSFNRKFVIVAFVVREVEDKREIDALALEAKLARLYYTQNIPEMNAMDLSRFDGTILQGAAAAKSDINSGWGMNSSWKDSKQVSSSANKGSINQTYESCRGLTGQRAEIFKYLRINGDEMVGASLDSIRQGISRLVYNPQTFDADIEHLASEGLIYSTSDDFHFAANA